MVRDRQSIVLVLLVVSAVLVSLVIHVRFVPQYFPDEGVEWVLLLLAGWVAYLLAFYALARLVSDPGPLPTMRAADIGIALFLLSLLLALAFDSFGFVPAEFLELYVIPALGIYVGLALIGWAVGQRTTAINRLESSE